MDRAVCFVPRWNTDHRLAQRRVLDRAGLHGNAPLRVSEIWDSARRASVGSALEQLEEREALRE